MTTNTNSIPVLPRVDVAAWKEIVARFQIPSTWRAVWQIVNTLVPYALIWWLMYLSLAVSWWLVVPLAVLAGAFLVRVFIIFHDCGHGSYFASRSANDTTGFLAGILTFTPYYHWRWEHAIHHSSAGDLDRRGTGDVWTLTVQEYLRGIIALEKIRLPAGPQSASSCLSLRHFYLFAIRQRFPSPKASKRERHSLFTP